jgi:hypothetical protein
MRHIEAKTMHELHDAICSRLLYAHTYHLDAYSSMEVELTHVYAESRTMDWDYELRRLWVPESRWRTMVRQYLDPDAVRVWLDTCAKRFGDDKKRGAAILRTNLVEKRVGGKGTVRSLGSCMLTLSFSLRPVPTLTLHSRTCYMGYLSVLDMSVAYHLARLIGDRLGLDHETFRFVWFLESAQFHGFRTLAFPLGDEDEYERFLNRPRGPEYPAMYNAHKHHAKFEQQDDEGVLYSGMPFTSYRRVRKRWHSEMFEDAAEQFSDPTTGKSDHRAYNPLPALHVRDLNFSAIGLE